MQSKKDRNKPYLKEELSLSKNVVIVCAPKGSDSVASGIALALYIEDIFNKKPEIVYTGDFIDINPELLELFDVKSSLPLRSLKVTIDYKGSQIHTVDYYKEEDSKLVLDIKPIGSDFDSSRIKYDYVGSSYDLVFSIGAKFLKDVGDIGTAKIINVDNSQENEMFGLINIVDENAKSLSEIIFAQFAKWGYVPNEKISKSLLIGLSG